MLRFGLGRLRVGLLIVVGSLLAGVTSSQAAVLTASATSCPMETSSQVFAPWGDTAYYSLVPGGTFESWDAPWSLSGGAADVAGNESFSVNSPSDSQSLSLPSGSSATSPTFCVGVQKPTVRFFARNSGDPNSTLGVVVNIIGPLGLPLSLPVANISASGNWEPTPVLPIVVNLLTLLPGNETPISLTLVPSGAGAWQVDDVYVDPYERT